MQNFKSSSFVVFVVFLFALACENIFSKTYNIEIRFVIEPENVLLASVCAVFSREILQAGAVKELSTKFPSLISHTISVDVKHHERVLALWKQRSVAGLT